MDPPLFARFSRAVVAVSVAWFAVSAWGADVEIRLIPRADAGDPHANISAPQPPAAIIEVSVGEPFVLEIWLSDTGDLNTGILGAFVDIDYDSTWVDGVSLVHSSLFSMMSAGDLDDDLGQIRNYGGVNAAIQPQALSPEWARLGWVEMAAGSPPAPALATFAGSVGIGGVGVFGRVYDDVDVQGATLAIVPEPSALLLITVG